ncbi:hypothetical protein CLTEP_24130 [Clostridium tepidiprofundi DSM 19306]|uniref:Uncharacterized protein n=1 Tax=Clostridium tepidiprofundi DSM 19306 TaxID=1121338 RepID=A0A151AUE3_9CLOT|nr:hypothetical protein [Clostridium tepidiprofundi]KYH31221.1 hypothetical protein CLTEP_24130 [Clostridium tepidiprofundi DSM 19306]
MIDANLLMYESQIQYLINDIKCEILNLVPDVEYLILTGSGGRGELSYININNELKLLSDLEFFAILKKDVNINKFRKKKIQKRIKYKYNNSPVKTPFFHVDVDFLSVKMFNNQDTLLMYETITNSKLIYGDNGKFNEEIVKKYKDKMCKIKKDFVIDKKDIHNILLYRHYAIISNLQFEDNNLSRTINLYAICRNSLDLLTIILYYNNITKTSYKQRIDFINEYSGKEYRYFTKIIKSKEFLTFINECYCYKEKPYIPETNNSFIDIMKKYIYYTNAILIEIIENFYECSIGSMSDGATECVLRKAYFYIEDEFFRENMSTIKKFVWNIYFSLVIKKDIRIFIKSISMDNAELFIQLNEFIKEVKNCLINEKIEKKIICLSKRKDIVTLYQSKYPYSLI